MAKLDSQTSDDALVKMTLKGRPDAFEALLERYQDYIFGLVARHVPPGEVEDLAQEAFIRAYKSLPGYQGRGKGFKSWLATIAVTACRDHWRGVYRRKETPVSGLSGDHEKWLDWALSETSVREMEARGAEEQARELLEAGLDKLPPDDRMVLELVYLEGLTGREAAKQLGWSTAKVKVRCHRARRKLEAFLLKLKGSEGI